jgi:hypothetical protein
MNPQTLATGKTPQQAFNNATKQPGTHLTKKAGYTHIPLPPKVMAHKVIAAIQDTQHTNNPNADNRDKRAAQKAAQWLTQTLPTPPPPNNTICLQLTGRPLNQYINQHGPLPKNHNLYIFT